MLANTCHQEFIDCLDQVMLSGHTGFSKKVGGNWKGGTEGAAAFARAHQHT